MFLSCLLLSLYVLALTVFSALSYALCMWLIIGWYGPLVHPDATLGFYQCFGVSMIVSAFIFLYTRNLIKEDISDDPKENIKKLIARLPIPYIMAGMHGVVYLICVLPFKG